MVGALRRRRYGNPRHDQGRPDLMKDSHRNSFPTKRKSRKTNGGKALPGGALTERRRRTRRSPVRHRLGPQSLVSSKLSADLDTRFTGTFLVIIFYGERHTTTIEDALSFCEVAVERLGAACWVAQIFTRRLRVHERYLVVAVLAMAYSASWLRNG